jgi:hypothetical protein
MGGAGMSEERTANSPTRATKKTAALLKVLLFFLCAKRLAQNK